MASAVSASAAPKLAKLLAQIAHARDAHAASLERAAPRERDAVAARRKAQVLARRRRGHVEHDARGDRGEPDAADDRAGVAERPRAVIDRRAGRIADVVRVAMRA